MTAAAFFDVDGTLVGRHIVHYYAYIRRQLLPRLVRPLWLATLLAKLPYYFVLDRVSRSQLNEVFYRNYAGLSADAVRGYAHDCFENVMRPHLFPDGVRCVAEHRAAGRRIVLVTGSIDFLIAPLAAHLGAAAVLAPALVERDGRFTGALDGPAVGQEEKARRVRAHADAEGLDLAASYAYGDSIADVPMLEQVGHPYAVNPDRALTEVADRNGWPTRQWRAGSVGIDDS